jgi:hypothetical protein
LKRLNVETLRRHWETIGFVAIGLVFILFVARPFEVVLGARDAGVYATAGFAIARTGAIAQEDELVRQIALDQRSGDRELREAAQQAETNLLGTQNPERFIASRLRYSGYLIHAGDLERGRVVPQFLHLYPAWIGLLASLLGQPGGLLATGLLGFLGLWSVGMLGRRLAGPWVGLLGMLFLALNGVQVWFSRYSTSEACAQFLGFAALYGFALMNDEPRATNDERRKTKDQGSTAGDQSHPHPLVVRRSALIPSRAWFGAMLAGVAAGQLALTRIDFFVIVAPLLLYLLYVLLTRRWGARHWALAGGLGLMLAHAALHVSFIARAYFFDTLFARLQDKSAILATLTLPFLTPILRVIFRDTPRSVLRDSWRLPLELALVAALAVAFVLLRRDGRPQRWLEAMVLRHRRGLGLAGALAIAVLGVYGYLIRPQILTAQTLAAAPGCLAPAQLRAPAGACLALQGYIGAPVVVPEHPNPVAHALIAAPKAILGPKLPPAASATASQPAELREAPDRGAALDRLQPGETVDLLGRSASGEALLARSERGVAGWVGAASLAVGAAAEALPVQADNIVDRIANPRAATTFSFANPGEAEKIAIAQANLARVGWYLSPLGVILGVAGFALWWLRGLNRASWLFLVASLVSTIFYVRLAYGTSDLTYIYILRRYMPLAYPAFSLGAAYAIVWLARRPTKDQGLGRSSLVFGLSSLVLALGLAGFLAATNRPIYRHVEYAGALDQLGAIAGRFEVDDVLLFRGEGRDTPDLVATPLKYAFGLNTFVIRSPDPGRYAEELARYVRRWREQGREVYLVLGANGAAPLPGFQATRLDAMTLRLPEFQQLRDQKPSGVLQFAFDFAVYRLDPAEAAPPAAPARVAVDDFAAQVRGFYRPEQIDGATVAWTDGDALLRLPWPAGASGNLAIDLAPGATRPAALGPARVCLAYQPEASFALGEARFVGERCFELGAGMRGYELAIDTGAQPAPATGTLLLRISSGEPWVPAAADPAQHDQRKLGVQFGGVSVGSRQ